MRTYEVMMKTARNFSSVTLIGLIWPEVAQATGDPGLLISFAIVVFVQIFCLINLIVFRGTRRGKVIVSFVFLVGVGWLVNLNLCASPYYFGEVLLIGLAVLYTYVARGIARD